MYIHPLLIAVLVVAVLAVVVIVRGIQASERINRSHDEYLIQMQRAQHEHAERMERMRLADNLTRREVLRLAAAHHVMPSDVRDKVIDGEIVVHSTAMEVWR